MFRRRGSGRVNPEHGRLVFLEAEEIDSMYVSPTLSVSSVLVADMDNKLMRLPILLETEDGKKVETQAPLSIKYLPIRMASPQDT